MMMAIASRSRLCIIVMAVIAFGSTSACDRLRGIYSYRYRITVEVDTPQGVRSGSSVWQIRQWKGSGIPDYAIRSRVKGEAVAVPLPGGALFAPLRGQDVSEYSRDYPDGIVVGHFGRHPQPGLEMGRDWWENLRNVIAAKPAFELYPDEFPLLVRFRDPNDPTSVEQVDASDLEGEFGPGVRLKRITIALTSDSPEQKIVQYLRWLKSPGAVLQKCPMFMPLSQRPLNCKLIYADFRRQR